MDTVKSNRIYYIGGSDIPTLLGLNKQKSYDELLEVYKGKSENTFDGNIYTEYGNLMEHTIRDYINIKLGINAIPDCRIFKNRKIRCNTDGYDKEKNIIIEIKTNNGKHSNTIDYEVQMQLYMWAFNCDKGYLVQYKRPTEFYNGIIFDIHSTAEYFNLEFDSNNVSIKEIKRSNNMITYILHKIKDFWQEVER